MTATEVVEPPAPPARPPAWRWRGVPLLFLLVGLGRRPAAGLVNARGVNSDAAVVGLQAMHILRGEWSWFLWGAGYQASFDAAAVAAGFAITGPSALTLMVVPLIGHLVLVGLTYDMLRRALAPAVGRAGAVLACLPLVFAPQSVNGVALYAPRQWSITAAVLGVWLAARAGAGRWGPLWLAGSGLVAGFAVYLDLFTLQLMPAVGVFALWWALAAPRRVWRVAALALGGRRGRGRDRVVARPAGGRRRQGRARPGADPRELGPADRAVPAVPAGREGLRPGPGHARPRAVAARPVGCRSCSGRGRSRSPPRSLCAAVAVVGRVGPGPVRRLGALGVLGSAASIGGFLLSTMPADLLSARYLAPIVWLAPFTLAPAVHALGSARVRRGGRALRGRGRDRRLDGVQPVRAGRAAGP